MVGFLIRKTFYDLWDNLFKIVILNVGFILVMAFLVFVPPLAAKIGNSSVFETALIIFGILCCFIYLAAAALCIKPVSDYGFFSFGDFFRNLKVAWRPGLVMGLFAFVLYLAASVIIPFYLAIESPVGLVFAAIVFWLAIFALISFQFFFTVYSRLTDNLFKALKKCVLISLDNTGFSFFSLFHNIVVLIFSFILALLFPGPVGILLFLDEALRLRLLKYDWLEANPEENRRKIPWDELLIEEREKTGTRTFKNFIFPWKD
jgi:hypothetical protein